ncbi:MAG: hypothetical protein IPJ43_03005, partial [Saprospiraceae bacterium]|nr:hypothetical protein [Saprospiraceae bacterium]
DVDRFNSYTQELRYLQQFNIGNFTNHIAGGLQLMTNDLHRTQLGKGSRNSDFDLNLVDQFGVETYTLKLKILQPL